MKNKQAFTREVIWNLRSKNINPGLQANNELQKRLGEELASHFAKMNVGSSYYEWLVDDDRLSVLSSASPQDKAKVMARIAEISEEVRSKISIPGYADCLLKYPNDDFVYYAIEPDGTVQVLITGWGCSNYNAARGGRGAKSMKAKEQVRVAFLVGGKRVPNRKFNISKGGQPNSNYLTTDDGGSYLVSEPLEVDTALKVFDVDSLKTFDLVVRAGQNLYEFDVTENCTVLVLVRQGGQPLVDEPVRVRYGEESYDCVTSAVGQAALSLPFIAETDLRVVVQGDEQVQEVCKTGNQFIFNLEEIVPPAIDRVVPTLQILDVKGNLVPHYALEVTQEEVVSTLQSDGDGVVVLPEAQLDTAFQVTDPKDTSHHETYRVTKEHCHFVFQLQGHPTTVRVIDAAEAPVVDLPIELQQGEKVLRLHLDGSGSCSFLAEEFVIGQQIMAKFEMGKDNRIEIPFTMEDGEYEYLLAELKRKKSPWLIFLEILAILVFLLCIYFLWPVFVGGTEGLADTILSQFK